MPDLPWNGNLPPGVSDAQLEEGLDEIQEDTTSMEEKLDALDDLNNEKIINEILK